MADEKKPKSDKPLFFGIVQDVWKTMGKPRGKEILTNTLIDLFYMGAEMGSNAVQRRIWNGDPHQSGSAGRSQTGRTGYSSRFNQVNGQNAKPKQAQDIGLRSSTQVQYIILPNRRCAEEVAKYMTDSITKFGSVTLSNYYDKCNEVIWAFYENDPNKDPNNQPKPVKPIYTDYNFGWTKVADIHYIQNRDGIVFNLPTPEQVRSN